MSKCQGSMPLYASRGEMVRRKKVSFRHSSKFCHVAIIGDGCDGHPDTRARPLLFGYFLWGPAGSSCHPSSLVCCRLD